MPKARSRAEELVPAGGDAVTRETVVDAVAEDLRTAQGGLPSLGSPGQGRVDSTGSETTMSAVQPSGAFVERYVDVRCPSGKHQSSMLTFRSHAIACMFCVPCAHGWTESTTHPALCDLATDTPR
jgi:hypothetical protein